MNYKIRIRLVALSMISVLLFGVFTPAGLAIAASGDTTVYITKTGECYHASGCSSLRKSKIATTLKDAVDRGYRACSKCHPGSLDKTSTATTTVSPKTTVSPNTTSAVDAAVEALKNYKGNNDEFNAYVYYINNADLQAAFGPDGDKLLDHFNEYGKTEGRKAK